MLSFTMSQLVAHLVGDYALQSDWMAGEKTASSGPAATHALTYALPFLFITDSPQALIVICLTHFVIDRWRLARFICYAKNYLAPRRYWHSWSDCSGTGYHNSRPPWLATWLLIITDNTMHLICNAAALSAWSS